jgi:hypothetical protein
MGVIKEEGVEAKTIKGEWCKNCSIREGSRQAHAHF